VTIGVSDGLSTQYLLQSQFLGELAGSPLRENHSNLTIKMVKACGYGLLAVTLLLLGVDLRDFSFTKKSATECHSSFINF
jgi:hypothetical protein